MVRSFNSGNFDEEVLKCDKIVLVDFFALWCGPCKALSPIIDRLSEDIDLSSKLCIGKLDIDESDDIAQNYGIMSVPTVILFKEGKEIDRIMGLMPQEELKSRILDTMDKQNI